MVDLVCSDYDSFLKSKQIRHINSGIDISINSLNPMLFDWQKDVVRWALFKGKSALFEDCGLGKTPQQLEWAKHVCIHTRANVLILAPLAVSLQTQREGYKFGINVNVCKSQDDVKPGINITNYERLDSFVPGSFSGVVLDESSILKNFTGKYRNQIINSFINTPYKLACTATPAPNDYTEIGNTAEFLGVMTRPEMLSMFFINDAGDTGKWRLKGHVKDNLFWAWLSSWAIMMRSPSDLGFDNKGFALPELKIHEHIIPFAGDKETLFVEYAKTLSDRRRARTESIDDRIRVAADLINVNGLKWIAWCNLNSESELLKANILNSIEVKGSDSHEHKENSLLGFAKNEVKCLVTKPRIAGFGMNFQNCHNMAFVGLSDSYEQFYQAIRRCWRFGQKEIVNVHIIVEEREGSVVENIKRKEQDMITMFEGMVKQMKELMVNELSVCKKTETVYMPKKHMALPNFMEMGGQCK